MYNQRINFCGPDVFMTPKLAICLVGDVPDKGNRRGKGELGRVECKHQPMPARFKTCPGRQLYQPLPLTGSGLARQYGNGPEGLPPRSRLIREPEVGKSDSAAPLLAMGSGSKGARSCRAETEPLTRHNATAQCRNGARLRHYMQQTAQARPFPKRSQRTNRGTPILYKF